MSINHYVVLGQGVMNIDYILINLSNVFDSLTPSRVLCVRRAGFKSIISTWLVAIHGCVWSMLTSFSVLFIFDSGLQSPFSVCASPQITAHI